MKMIFVVPSKLVEPARVEHLLKRLRREHPGLQTEIKTDMHERSACAVTVQSYRAASYFGHWFDQFGFTEITKISV